MRIDMQTARIAPMLPEIDRKAFEQAFEQAMTQFRAPVKDWPEFVRSAYDEDAILMPPDMPAVRGREAILAFLQAFPVFSGHRQTSLEADGAGDFIFTRDAFSCTLTLPGAPPTFYAGKALTIWRRQADGEWKMFREIWNREPPARG
ncbi:MAG: DUF4440 domain-containing protein, partial [Verrucomicrobia bacterium]|nr:DUF4440 domain-containing protein [Verrucomicrobiota bacterium]